MRGKPGGATVSIYQQRRQEACAVCRQISLIPVSNRSHAGSMPGGSRTGAGGDTQGGATARRAIPCKHHCTPGTDDDYAFRHDHPVSQSPMYKPNGRSDTGATARPTPTLRMLTVQESIGATQGQRIPTAIAGLAGRRAAGQVAVMAIRTQRPVVGAARPVASPPGTANRS